MIEKYVKKLIKNLPLSHKKETIDLILDGGVFNGSYQIGSLYFLKEMENQQKIKIDKFSGCSIGAICAVLYFINKLNLSFEFYNISINCLKENKNLNSLHTYIDTILKPLLPVDIHKQISNKIYISYYNIKTHKKIIRSKYKSVNDVITSLKRSSFFPFLINGNPTFDKYYIDGIYPHILNCEPNKKVLYISLFTYDKIEYLFSVKNEKSNYHRILTGLLDIHLFFIKKTNTEMCSYINDWSLYYSLKNKIIKYVIEKITLYFVVIYIFIKKNIPIEIVNSIFMKILHKFWTEIYELLIDNYCF